MKSEHLVVAFSVALLAAACAGNNGERMPEDDGAGDLGQAPTEGAQAGLELPPGFEENGLTVQENPNLGAYLTDLRGRTVYLFMADPQNGQRSTCADDCAAAWPPVTAGERFAFTEGIRQELLGAIPRADGSMQVTYNGWPLYYYGKDAAPGQVTGQDVADFGAEWYVVSPAGEPIREGQAAR